MKENFNFKDVRIQMYMQKRSFEYCTLMLPHLIFLWLFMEQDPSYMPVLGYFWAQISNIPHLWM